MVMMSPNKYMLEIEEVVDGKVRVEESVLKNAPHTMDLVVASKLSINIYHLFSLVA